MSDLKIGKRVIYGRRDTLRCGWYGTVIAVSANSFTVEWDENPHEFKTTKYSNIAWGGDFKGEYPDDHKKYIFEIPKEPNKNIQIKEDLTMKKTKLFETRDLVNGEDVATMTEDQLFEAIRQIEDDIRSLEVINAKSVKIDKRIKEYKEAIAKIVKVLDAK